jgi:DNA-directed RNA polymerase specialized sigma subunit
MNSVAKNIINKYGKKEFAVLIMALKENVPLKDIAKNFGVSKQRVHQWKQELGQSKVVFLVYKDILDMLK